MKGCRARGVQLSGTVRESPIRSQTRQAEVGMGSTSHVGGWHWPLSAAIYVVLAVDAAKTLVLWPVPEPEGLGLPSAAWPDLGRNSVCLMIQRNKQAQECSESGQPRRKIKLTLFLLPLMLGCSSWPQFLPGRMKQHSHGHCFTTSLPLAPPNKPGEI